MKQYKIKLVVVCLLFISLFSACEKEELNNEIINTHSTIIEKFGKGRFDNIPFKWDYTLTPVISDGLFIGDQFISVDNRYIVTPPPIYLGASYVSKDFGTIFKPEIVFPRNPIDVVFNFTIPFVGRINNEFGSKWYRKLLVDALDSKQYKYNIDNKILGYDIKLVEAYSYSDIEKAFPKSKGALGENLLMEVKKLSKLKDVQSILIGQLSCTNFTVYMDFAVKGFFKDKMNNNNLNNPVYIQSITYGKCAFFVIESRYSYKEIKDVVLSRFSLANRVDKEKEILNNSTITLFVVSNNFQIVKVKSSMEDLDMFLHEMFDEYSYGYPIYCQGAFTKDNTLFEE